MAIAQFRSFPPSERPKITRVRLNVPENREQLADKHELKDRSQLEP
ncbi:hypothetical protein CKA32_001791 [Geitlerinema sp. FC II]|nr:hypothetical protein CKA32_001791 [Geitlerinema sp. FC II]